jgi:hypothetical protein
VKNQIWNLTEGFNKIFKNPEVRNDGSFKKKLIKVGIGGT